MASCGLREEVRELLGGFCPGGLNPSPVSLGGVGSVFPGRGAVAEAVDDIAAPGQYELAWTCVGSSENDLLPLAADPNADVGLMFSNLYFEKSRLGRWK